MKFSCEKCDQHFTVDQDQVGLEYECPTCGFSGVVPSGNQSQKTLDTQSRRKTNLIYTAVALIALLCFCVFLQAGLGIKLVGSDSGRSESAPTHVADESDDVEEVEEAVIVKLHVRVAQLRSALNQVLRGCDKSIARYPNGYPMGHNPWRALLEEDMGKANSVAYDIIDLMIESEKQSLIALNPDFKKAIINYKTDNYGDISCYDLHSKNLKRRVETLLEAIGVAGEKAVIDIKGAGAHPPKQ